MRTMQTVMWKGKKYFIVSETENYMLASHNGKDKFFSILKTDPNLEIIKSKRK